MNEVHSAETDRLFNEALLELVMNCNIQTGDYEKDKAAALELIAIAQEAANKELMN
jgi:hypothetical protein